METILVAIKVVKGENDVETDLGLNAKKKVVCHALKNIFIS